jgi:plasmid maintenance system killer protein
MQVTFRTRKLERQYLESAKAIQAYGLKVGRRYIQRVNIIKQAGNLKELIQLPGLKCHPLSGNRKGQYAMTLIDRWRLIFTLKGAAMEIINIEEVSKHYEN